ncbi:MAG: BMP family ABC transporter substrate-binding protein [Clostridiales bacterium]|jgi:basic membrane protein A|nr:BMP family ABC transporter substrate-binding protein [Clostridiales bacterium]
MNKVIAVISAIIFGLSLSACGNPPAQTSEAASETAGEAASAASSESIGSNLRIAIVTSPNGVDDGSFNQNNYEGAQNFIQQNPDSTVQAIRETDINNSVPTVENILADYDVIVAPGYQFAGISSIAMDNPDKYFIIVDSFPDAIEDQLVFENILGITFAEQESGFYAGIAAAMQTQTGKVAVVNGIAYPSNVNYQYGFESGVTYANARLGANAEVVSLASYAGTDVTNVNVGGNYIGSFDDEAAGKVLGEALLGEGADIIFVAAGGAGNGVFTAVKEHGDSFVIGCDVDQYDDGVNGDKNIILTSVLKVMDINVERALIAIADGTFTGNNVVLGTDTDSTGFVKANGRHQMDADTVAALDNAYELVKSGSIVPASNFNGHKPNDFPGLS